MKTIKYILFFGILIFAFLSAMQFKKYLKVRSNLVDKKAKAFLETAQDAEKHIIKYIEQNIQKAEDLAFLIKDSKNINPLLENFVKNHPNLEGAGFAYNPSENQNKLHAPYYEKDSKWSYFEEKYDYTKKEWYKKALQSGKHWSHGLFNKLNKDYTISFFIPIYNNNKLLGILFLTYSSTFIHDFIQSLDVGATGYAAIFSKQGFLVSHSDKNIDKEGFKFKLQGKEKTLITIKKPKTSLPSWEYFVKIPSTDWVLVINCFQNIEPTEITTLKRDIIWLVLYIAILLIFLISVFLKIHEEGYLKWWFLSIVSSLLFLIIMVIIWNLEIKYAHMLNTKSILTNKTALEENLKNTLKHKKDDYIYIPTGILISDLEFPDSNNLKITGHLWQIYETNSDISKEIHILRSKDEKLKKVNVIQEGDKEKIVWKFSCLLSQKEISNKYPLETKHIQIKFINPAINKNIIFIPDFKSYQFINPYFKPGFETNVELKNWTIDNSFFNYSSHVSDGKLSLYEQKNLPLLTFNIIIKRNFIGFFIVYVLSLLISLMLLFYTFILISRKKRLTLDAILQITAQLMFIITLAHITLRSTLKASDIMYIEYFYLISYFLIGIMLVSIWGFISYPKTKFFSYKDNLIPKLLYWPITTFLFMLVTLIIFY